MFDIWEIFEDFRMWLSDIFFEISEWIMPKSYKPYDYNHYEDYIQKLSGM